MMRVEIGILRAPRQRVRCATDCIMLSAKSAEKATGLAYERHRPEQTLLYQIVERHYPDFLSAMEAQDRPPPGYVQEEFGAFLQKRD